MSEARNLGETAFVRERGQPSAEIVRVGCAKPRRNCVTRFAWSTLCGDRACRMCEMYAVPLGHWNALIFAFANVSHETLILEGLFVSFCECLAQNAHFGRSLCQFLRMSRTKRSFWKVSLSVFANVSYETLILEGLFSQFLRMSRTKRSFWKVSLSVFANVSYETLVLEGFILSVFANVSYETLILEDFLDAFKGGAL